MVGLVVVDLVHAAGFSRMASVACAQLRWGAVAGASRELHSSVLLSDRVVSSCQSRSLCGRALHRLRSAGSIPTIRGFLRARIFSTRTGLRPSGLPMSAVSMRSITIGTASSCRISCFSGMTGRSTAISTIALPGRNSPMNSTPRRSGGFSRSRRSRYLIAQSELGWPSKWLTEIVEQHRGGAARWFRL